MGPEPVRHLSIASGATSPSILVGLCASVPLKFGKESTSLLVQAEEPGVDGAVAVSPPTREGCPRSSFPSTSATIQLGQGSSTQIIRPYDGLLYVSFAYLVVGLRAIDGVRAFRRHSAFCSLDDSAMTKQAMEGERETKRVKLVHNATLNANSAPMQRRLRKMSEEFQPSSFCFLAQARLLCVGMSVVYRVSLSLAITSTCTSGTTDGSTTSSGHTTRSAWVIAMSQTKFRGFYSQVNAILRQPSVTQQLAPTNSQLQQQQGDEDVTVVEWKPFEVFLRILTEVLQRYEYLQHSAFLIQADTNTMSASKVGLEGFLSDCWRALEVIVPALVVEPYLPAPLGREVLCIYLLMRDFLSLPESVLDANCTYANAILSLEDVEDLLPTHSENSCSICLEPLVSADTKGIELSDSGRGNNSESDSDQGRNESNSSSDSEEAVAVDASTANFSVKLPCAHVYHENCIMSWLRHNPSCPECRAPAGASL